jgi:hypothetical protein
MKSESSQTYKLSDHDYIYTNLPIITETTYPPTPPPTSLHTKPTHHPNQPHTATQTSSPHDLTPPEDTRTNDLAVNEEHRWIQGECVAEYNKSAI